MANNQLNSEQATKPLTMDKKGGDTISDENINLGALYLKTLFLFRYVLRKWWVLLIWMLIGMFTAYGYVLYKGRTYTTQFAFNVVPANNSASILSNALAVSGFGGGSSSGSYDNNYFSTFIQSQRDIKSALLKDAIVNGKHDILANHFIDVYKWRGPWKSNKKLQFFRFKSHNLYNLTALEDSILTLEYYYIIGAAFTDNYTTGSPVVSIMINTPSKDFSRGLSSQMCKAMNDYYLTDIYGRNVQNVNTAQHKVDSLAYIMKDIQTRIAHFNDNNYNLIKQQGSTELTILTRDLGLITNMYNSAVSNLDAAKTTLIINTPVLDIVDDPNFATVVSFVKWVILVPIGALAGIFFGIVYLIMRKMVLDSARREKQRIAEFVQSTTL